MSRYITVEADVCVDDVIDGLTDSELEAAGLCRIEPRATDELRAALYQAAESGNCAALFNAVEAMAWELDGKILVAKVAV